MSVFLKKFAATYSSRLDGENILLGCCFMKASTTALGVVNKSDRISIRFWSLSRSDDMPFL